MQPSSSSSFLKDDRQYADVARDPRSGAAEAAAKKQKLEQQAKDASKRDHNKNFLPLVFQDAKTCNHCFMSFHAMASRGQ